MRSVGIRSYGEECRSACVRGVSVRSDGVRCEQ